MNLQGDDAEVHLSVENTGPSISAPRCTGRPAGSCPFGDTSLPQTIRTVWREGGDGIDGVEHAYYRGEWGVGGDVHPVRVAAAAAAHAMLASAKAGAMAHEDLFGAISRMTTLRALPKSVNSMCPEK